MTPLRIATRGSPLALWQARWVAAALTPDLGGRPVEWVILRTTGDEMQSPPLAAIGGAGLFTREIQRAVRDGQADLAVHSLKDLPTAATPGLILAAIPERGPVADVLVSTRWPSLDQLPPQARIATGSPRRAALLRHRRPDLRFEPLRGNIETRLRKLEEQGLDAIILAEAGLNRLDLGQRITERLDPAWMVPAVGQGALAVEVRADDGATLALTARIDHAATRQETSAERALLRTLGSGCQLPVGALGRVSAGQLVVHAVVLDRDGRERLEAKVGGDPAAAEPLGEALGVELLGRGAGRLLAGI
ncbi:MAG TPA: hydroxymethylbilane synthase [Gemmatales bacterium]|nr:hydroxymethylbilane synthase [Gemmatales bacterium]HMP59593.1 hydroxymethylbilane synthase [Gemmatales bacterium]